MWPIPTPGTILLSIKQFSRLCHLHGSYTAKQKLMNAAADGLFQCAWKDSNIGVQQLLKEMPQARQLVQVLLQCTNDTCQKQTSLAD